MIRNYITLAFRNLLKRKLFSFVIIFGLAMGIAACLVILKYIDFETSYDNFHASADNLYRVTRTIHRSGQDPFHVLPTTYGLAPALQVDFPEVKRTIRVHPMYGGVVIIHTPEAGDTRSYHEDNVLIVDSTFLHAFTFESVVGQKEKALDEPHNIVINETIATRFFGNENPIGKTLKLAGGWIGGDFTVSSVIKNVPGNSHFNFDVLVPSRKLFDNRQYKEDNGWGWNNFWTYVQLNTPADLAKVNAKLPDFAKRQIDIHHTEENYQTVLHLQPLTQIHLEPGLRGDEGSISRSSIYFFAIIAAFILFIAWINYINLSTARALERAREVGIKKSIGAHRRQLMFQFFSESVIVNFLGVLLAVGLAVLLLPLLAEITEKNLSFDFFDRRLWIAIVGLFVFGSVASGVYPAFVLSSFKIVDVLKGKSVNRGFSLRKALVVFQFCASLLLIAGTFVVYRQISFMMNADKGLNMEQMLVVKGPATMHWKIARDKIAVLRDEAKKIPGVQAVATSASIPGKGHNWGANIRRSGTQPSDYKGGSVVWIDPDFIPAYDMQFLAGKNFDLHIKSDMESAIVNEASLQAFGLGTAEEALNEQLIMGDDTVAIIGVLKNYNWNSLKSDLGPFVLRADTLAISYISFQLAGNDLSTSVASIEKLYKEMLPDNPFDFYFLDEFFNSQYKAEQQFGTIFGLFAILAVVIACLGLWGLAAFTTAQKMKEISVRKVLGASVTNIVVLLSRRFLSLILIAGVISVPLTWYAVDTWLRGFAFRVGIQWDLFVLPLLMLIIIALLTVSLQVLRGAMANPAKVLRSE